MKRFSCYLALTSALIVAGSISAFTQTQPDQLRAIPAPLRAGLAHTLNDFCEAQRSATWSRVSELLGPYFYGLGWERTKYSTPQKAWMTETLKQNPMLKFTAHSAGYSTAILSLPFRLKYWVIEGDARYSDSADAISLPMLLIAYRESGEWYLSPFSRNECGDLRLPNVPEFSAKAKAEDSMPTLSLLPQPGLPIDVLDIAVEEVGNVRCTMLHQVNFKVRNRTKKTVTGYGFQIQDVRHVGSKDYGTSVGAPNEVPPGVTAANHNATTFTAYRPHVLWFNWVDFADGTEWRAMRSAMRVSKHRRTGRLDSPVN